MHRSTSSRDRRHDLLARPPCGMREPEDGWAAILADPVAQLRELADMRRQGLLTDDEFEGQKAKVLAG